MSKILSKIVLVHDWLTYPAGAEQVLYALAKIFPQAPIYTLIADQKAISHTPLASRDIRVSFLQRLPASKRYYRYLLPLFPLVIEQFDLSAYDTIVSSSTCAAKGVLVRSDQLHICYCHTPMRYAWDLYFSYLGSLKGFKAFWVRVILHYLRLWDVLSSQRVDYFLANSRFVARRIAKVYGRKAWVIYPPVDTDFFRPDPQKERQHFYLTVCRLVPYKRVDLLLEAFRKRPDRFLIVIGKGPEEKRLRRKAPSNVKFLGACSREKVREFLQQCKGFVYAAEEDFGISLVEAQACGTPVLCYGKGGALETVLPFQTGIFFKSQSPESFLEALEIFERQDFDPHLIRKQAERFNQRRFQEAFHTWWEETVGLPCPELLRPYGRSF